jgi:hypothetical protein
MMMLTDLRPAREGFVLGLEGEELCITTQCQTLALYYSGVEVWDPALFGRISTVLIRTGLSRVVHARGTSLCRSSRFLQLSTVRSPSSCYYEYELLHLRSPDSKRSDSEELCAASLPLDLDAPSSR